MISLALHRFLCSGNISVHHCREKKRWNTKRRFSFFFSLPRYSFSLNKLEADILQGRPGQLHKKTRLHTCENSPRPSFPLGLNPLSTRTLPFFASARASSSRYTLVHASRRRDDELLLSRKTTSLPFPLHTYVTAITNRQQSAIISRF